MNKKNILMVISWFLFIPLLQATLQPIGPYGINASYLLQARSDSMIIYASARKAILKSNNKGVNWKVTHQFKNIILSLTVHPTDPNILYVGSKNNIYRSKDGGISFLKLSLPSPYLKNFRGIAINKASPQTIWAISDYIKNGQYQIGFIKSIDGGISFEQKIISKKQNFAFNLAVGDEIPNIYITVVNMGLAFLFLPKIYKSTDLGETFQEIDIYNTPERNFSWSIIDIHPSKANILYLTINGKGLFISEDGGETWNKKYNYIQAVSLAISKINPNVMLLGGKSEILKSTDSGDTWKKIKEKIPGGHIWGLQIDQQEENMAYACNDYGLFRSINSGEKWSETNGSLNFLEINTMALSPSNPNTIITKSNSSVIFKSIDSGDSWSKLDSPPACGRVASFLFHRSDPNIVFALEGGG